MRMEVPLRVSLVIRRLLMKTHRVREGNLEEVVVASGNPLQNVRQMATALLIKQDGAALVYRERSGNASGRKDFSVMV